MQLCEHCGAQDLRWFTPASRATRAAVLLCMTCCRLTIVGPARSRAGEVGTRSTEHAA
jgi:hypothetical protein